MEGYQPIFSVIAAQVWKEFTVGRLLYSIPRLSILKPMLTFSNALSTSSCAIEIFIILALRTGNEAAMRLRICDLAEGSSGCFEGSLASASSSSGAEVE